MVSFLAVYRGDSLQSAELVAVSTDPGLVESVAGEILTDRSRHPDPGDPALDSIRRGKRRALQLVRDEAGEEAGGG